MSTGKGRPRDPNIPTAQRYCRTHGMTEHRQHADGPTRVRWRCMACGRERANAAAAARRVAAETEDA